MFGTRKVVLERPEFGEYLWTIILYFDVSLPICQVLCYRQVQLQGVALSCVSHFMGQNETRLIAFHLLFSAKNQVLDNKERLVNIDTEFLVLVAGSNFTASSNHALTNPSCTKNTMVLSLQEPSIV